MITVRQLYLILACVLFRIGRHQMPVDRCSHREKGQPLCMEQYDRLFSSSRIPGIDKDTLFISSNDLAESEHIIVMCRNQMFVLDVKVNFTRLNEDQIYQQLRRIENHAESEEEADVGFLTSLPRDEWARARVELTQGERTYNGCTIIISCEILLLLYFRVR